MVDRPDRSSSEMEEKLLKYSTSNNSWSKVLIPFVGSHVLTTYHSKLLLIGRGKVFEFDASEYIFLRSQLVLDSCQVGQVKLCQLPVKVTTFL